GPCAGNWSPSPSRQATIAWAISSLSSILFEPMAKWNGVPPPPYAKVYLSQPEDRCGTQGIAESTFQSAVLMLINPWTGTVSSLATSYFVVSGEFIPSSKPASPVDWLRTALVASVRKTLGSAGKESVAGFCTVK